MLYADGTLMPFVGSYPSEEGEYRIVTIQFTSDDKLKIVYLDNNDDPHAVYIKTKPEKE